MAMNKHSQIMEIKKIFHWKKIQFVSILILVTTETYNNLQGRMWTNITVLYRNLKSMSSITEVMY